jgi:hypothetical protein
MSQELSITTETAAFELLQRRAKALSSSTLVPKEFQGNPANCLIAMNLAARLRADEFMIMQSLDIIHGRPSFRAQFLIAMVNSSGRFTPLQFRMTGEGKSRACVAHCKSTDTGEPIEGPEISIGMANAEGWLSKNGSKWQTMPELMLRYRAAAFFARLYAPDITLGMQTSEELHDIAPPRDVTPAKVPSVSFLPEKQAAPAIEQESPKGVIERITDAGLKWGDVGKVAEANGILVAIGKPWDQQSDFIQGEVEEVLEALINQAKEGK